MPEVTALTDPPEDGAQALSAGALLFSWTDACPGAVRVYLQRDDALPSTPLERRRRRELELRACSIVLDLLALALIDRTDVEGIVRASIAVRRSERRIALSAGGPRDGVTPIAEAPPEAPAAASPAATNATRRTTHAGWRTEAVGASRPRGPAERLAGRSSMPAGSGER
jgi:hypothetical protein